MKKFEVGKTYEWYQREYDPIKVIGRTKCFVIVQNSCSTWRMKVKTDVSGDEYAVDSSVPKTCRDAFTVSAKWACEESVPC